MWQPTESTCKKFHLAGSLATLAFGLCTISLCLFPDSFPAVYRILSDERAAASIPYLLFIALVESLFSLWYFVFRK